MDYDLSRLGSREFEHVVQALGMAELGPQVVPFGDGPDGGRDATFTGAVNMPASDGSGNWNGYGVIQAKFRFRPEDPASNLEWLEDEMSKEFRNWRTPPKDSSKPKRKTPDYYLLATNVRLSAYPDNGGNDTASRSLKNRATALGIKDCVLWHYDPIARLLDAHPGIRQSYAGFITSGDVLESMRRILNAESLFEIGKRMRIHAGQQLYGKQHVSLGDVERQQDDRLRLSDVAVDLPARIDISENHRQIGEVIDTAKFAVSRGDRKLVSNDENIETQSGIVIIGGPGQGKSTLAQLICQIYRAAIVGTSEGAGLGRATDAVHVDTLRSLEKLKIPLPMNRRWPIYVELSKLGDAIAGEFEPDLLRYMASQIMIEGENCTSRELLSWLRAWPSVIVLDGLDEVPHKKARAKVIEAIGRFLTVVNGHGCDVYVIATSRPQGYNNEFGEFELEQVSLCDLDSQRATAYAQKVISARFQGDEEKIRDIMERVKEVSVAPATSRLMKSPLQVTIMTYLMEKRRNAPQTRHELFDLYYRTIFYRETTKGGHLGSKLELHQADIDAIHAEVAKRLQIRCEHAGESDSVLSLIELEEITRKRLLDVGHESKAANALVKDLKRASTDRIVLLIGSKVDHIGFEVRSLQEYMASRALVDDSEPDVIIERLAAASTSSHWRNTWLLAVGRIFARYPYLQDRIMSLLRRLDCDTEIVGPMALLAGTGQRLAIDMLEDDVAYAYPRYQRMLLAHALDALSQWPGPDTFRLASVVRQTVATGDDESWRIVKSRLLSATSGTPRHKLSAFVFYRAWEREDGRIGGIAKDIRRILDRDADVQSIFQAERRSSLGKVVSAHFDFQVLGIDTRKTARRMADRLNSLELPIFRFQSDLGQLSKLFVSIRDAAALEEILSSENVSSELSDSIDQIGTEDAIAAIWIRQAILTLIERRVVGDNL